MQAGNQVAIAVKFRIAVILFVLATNIHSFVLPCSQNIHLPSGVAMACEYESHDEAFHAAAHHLLHMAAVVAAIDTTKEHLSSHEPILYHPNIQSNFLIFSLLRPPIA